MINHEKTLRRLTPAQEEVFVPWVANPTSTSWNLPCMLRFPREADARRLRQALLRVTASQPVLRTRFVLGDGGEPRQFVDHAMTIDVRLSQMTDEAATRYVDHAFVRPFSPFGGEPLCRFEVIETQNHCILLLDLHHTIADGVTISHLLLRRDLAEEYQRLSPHKATPAPVNRNVNASVTVPTGLSCLSAAAYALTLSRLQRERQVTFATLYHGRTDRKSRQQWGMFVRSLPVTVDCPDELSVEAFLGHVRRALTTAMRKIHQPLSQLWGSLRELPQTTFGFQGPNVVERCQLGPFRGEGRQLPVDEARGGFSCLVYLSERGCELRTTGSPTVFDKTFQRCFVRAMLTVAARMKANPQARLGDLALASDDEQAALRVLGRGEELPLQAGETFPDLFIRQAAKTPHAIAVEDEDSQLTYQQLADLSARRASQLLAQGFNPAQPVAVKPRRTCQFLVDTLGVMRAGGFYYVESGAALLRQAELQSPTRARPSQPASQFQPASAPANGTLAYMLFTSGSTGKPKGVMVSHRALTSFVKAVAWKWNLNGQSRISCHSDFAFDASVEDLYPVLTVGGRVIIVPERLRRDVAGLHRFLCQRGATGGCYMPDMAVLLARQGPLPVDYLCLGGDRMTQMPLTQARVLNTYGPTEFTVDATYADIDPSRTYTDYPIGRPLPGVQAYVIDKAGQLLPRGSRGQLCLAGAQMAEGYWQEPRLTEERFRESRFSAGRVYLTGDLVSWDDQGQLRFHGREDRMVKLRGYRIELAAVEKAMTDLPSVCQATASVQTINGRQHLCASYTANDGITPQEVERQLRLVLPSWMVPKVTPAPTGARASQPASLLQPAATLPRHPQERGLPSQRVNFSPPPRPDSTQDSTFAALFALVLNLPEVSADDDFFELGGTSIDVMHLVMEAAARGRRVTYPDVFIYKTPRALEETERQRARARQQQLSAEGPACQAAHSASPVPAPDNVTVPAPDNVTAPVADNVTVQAILLTGATGYLGRYVLWHYLTQTKRFVYCLVRRQPAANQPARENAVLRHVLRQTFGNQLPQPEEELFAQRLAVVACDMTQTDWQTSLWQLPAQVGTVINCAADVRLFAPAHQLRLINVDPLHQLIAFCRERGARLIHISTISADENAPQGLGAVPYVESKRQAEALVLEALSQKLTSHAAPMRPLDARIIRVGNLVPPFNSQLPFTLPPQNNLFLNMARRLKARYKEDWPAHAGISPGDVDISPVDVAARAVALLAEAPSTPAILQVQAPSPTGSPTAIHTLHLLKQMGFVWPSLTSEWAERLLGAL